MVRREGRNRDSISIVGYWDCDGDNISIVYDCDGDNISIVGLWDSNRNDISTVGHL